MLCSEQCDEIVACNEHDGLGMSLFISLVLVAINGWLPATNCFSLLVVIIHIQLQLPCLLLGINSPDKCSGHIAWGAAFSVSTTGDGMMARL